MVKTWERYCGLSDNRWLRDKLTLKHDTLIQCWFNVGACVEDACPTINQHWMNVSHHLESLSPTYYRSVIPLPSTCECRRFFWGCDVKLLTLSLLSCTCREKKPHIPTSMAAVSNRNIFLDCRTHVFIAISVGLPEDIVIMSWLLYKTKNCWLNFLNVWIKSGIESYMVLIDIFLYLHVVSGPIWIK